MLYQALVSILADHGPLSALYALELPIEQVNDDGVDVAFIPISGVGATTALGSTPVANAPFDAPGGGAGHDGGVLWWHTGVQFQIRAADGFDGDSRIEAMRIADIIRDTLSQYRGEPAVVDSETIYWAEVTGVPSYLEQDELGRDIIALTVEVWHKTTSYPPVVDYDFDAADFSESDFLAGAAVAA